MLNALNNKVAIVTGSGKGIGQAIALSLAQEGAKVIINDIVSENANSVVREIQNIGGQASAFLGDISKFDAARQLIQSAVDNFGRIDILINNAGNSLPGPIWEISEEDWDRTIDIHLKGTFNCTRHACQFMKEQNWGRIINTTSVAWLGARHHSSYSAAKAGIVGFTYAVAKDMNKYGVTCNAYRPLAQTQLSPSKEREEAYMKAVKEGDLTEAQAKEFIVDLPGPDTIPPLLIYLCSDKAANVTGKVFYIRGSDIGIYSDPVMKRFFHKEKGIWNQEELDYIIPKMLEE